ncbi:hypothetical protein TNCV_3406041 [Trichonephila clavipes]|nr:hypothetical protein TNCV_3406041 [Trichonephila clavipes]
MNKMSRCRTRNLAPVHSRRGRECDCEFRTNRTLMRLWAEFCGLPMISDEGHVVDSPLVFNRVFLAEKRPEETEKKEGKETRERERSPAWGGEKGKALPWMEKG